MTIGLDIDDTMTNSNETIRKYATDYFKGEDLDVILNAPKIDGRLLEFLDQHSDAMMREYTLKENVKEVIERLRSNGHKIVIITARGYALSGDVFTITTEYFKKKGIVIDEIIFRQLEKAPACVEHHVDLMIDDSIKTLEDVRARGIKTLLFTSEKNKNADTDFIRVSTWLEIEDYINNQ